MADNIPFIPRRNAPSPARQVLGPLDAQVQHYKFANGVELVEITAPETVQAIGVVHTVKASGLVSDAYELLMVRLSKSAESIAGAIFDDLKLWSDDPATATIDRQILVDTTDRLVAAAPVMELVTQADLGEVYWMNTTSIGRSASRAQDAQDRGSLWVQWLPKTQIADIVIQIYLRPLNNNGDAVAAAV